MRRYWFMRVLLLANLAGILPCAAVFLLVQNNVWLAMFISALLLVASACVFSHLLYIQHLREADRIAEEARFKDAILRFVQESSGMKTREDLYSLILETAVQSIPHATAGSLLKVITQDTAYGLPQQDAEHTPKIPPKERQTRFEAAYGHDMTILKDLNLRLEETFNYVLTKGKCDRTVVVHNYQDLNRELLDPERYAQLESGTSDISSSSIMSAPVTVEGVLWGMLTIDSAAGFDFTEQHIQRLDVFVNETVKIIRLFREQERNLWLMRHDPLTGLLNRSHFTEMFKADLQAAARGEVSGVLISMDLDHFKSINDHFGHVHGDEALVHFSRVFAAYLKKGDYLSRYGGDEFVAVFRNSDLDEAVERIQTIARALSENPLFIGTSREPLRFSHGMVVFNRSSHSHQQLMHASDAFMYECKREHREMRL